MHKIKLKPSTLIIVGNNISESKLLERIFKFNNKFNNKYDFNKYKFNNMCCKSYIKLIGNLKTINADDIKWFALIIEIAKCNKCSDVLVAILEKTNLDTKQKQDIILLKDIKYCDV